MTLEQIFSPATRVVPEWSLTDRLRKSRENCGFTQAELGAQMGLNHKIIGNVERGTTPINGPLLILWAALCNVDYDWLKDGKTPPSGPQGPDGGLPLPGLDSNQEPIGVKHHSNILPFRTRGISEGGLKKAA
jgi:transcriptional regulator with XRE-family HTH domain